MNLKPFVSDIVHNFYVKAQSDILIGYHFARIKDFDTHIPRIIAFWETQLLGLSYKFDPPLDVINAHIPLRIHRGEVGRWMKLFRETLDESQIPEMLKQDWDIKLSQFEQVFLRHPLLFASSD
jgi:truncated hemoglobin YjbI